MHAPSLFLQTHRFARYPLLPRLHRHAPVPPFLPPLFPSAVQGSAFPGAFVSCGTYVLSSAKTSTFIGFLLVMHIYALHFSYIAHGLYDLPCLFASILFRRCRLPLASTNMFRLFGCVFAFSLVSPTPRSTLCAQLVNRFAFLLCSLTVDALLSPTCFSDRRPEIAALFLGYTFSFSLSPTLPFCLTPLFFYYIII